MKDAEILLIKKIIIYIIFNDLLQILTTSDIQCYYMYIFTVNVRTIKFWVVAVLTVDKQWTRVFSLVDSWQPFVVSRQTVSACISFADSWQQFVDSCQVVSTCISFVSFSCRVVVPFMGPSKLHHFVHLYFAISHPSHWHRVPESKGVLSNIWTKLLSFHRK